ncbi:MAG: polynucleotide kinase-phosphatase [Candidatus Dormibacteria bacterium]
MTAGAKVLALPELCLVALVGISGSGKSEFARRHFRATQVLSSDYFRGLVSDDDVDQAASADAFDALYYVAGKRLALGRLTVVDATNVQREARRQLVQVARDHDVLPVAIVLDLPQALCAERNRSRPDRQFGSHVLRQQSEQLRRSVRQLSREGFRRVHRLQSPEDVAAAVLRFEPLLTDLRSESGPFDAIGDVHGCRTELVELLGRLGYQVATDQKGRPIGAHHPERRRAIFLGDMVDRGPDTPGVLRLVMGMVGGGDALAVPGNHEQRLVRALRGVRVQPTHGLAEALSQLSQETPEFRREVEEFCYGLVSHYLLDEGRLVVAHAGLKEVYQGRASSRVRDFALYGETTGETDEFGLPVRHPWAREYRGQAAVLYGHTPVAETEWVNNTICLDTGCVFGGRLSALRYPERELVSVPAARVWYAPVRPLRDEAPRPEPTEGVTGQPSRAAFDLLDVSDVLGHRVIATRHHPAVSIRAENAAAALEVVSRYAIDPRWLVYLPPTMAPAATSGLDEYLEYPTEAVAEYAARGVERVLAEEKHMGSRAVVLVCRSQDTARSSFGAEPGELGTVYTRLGRPFFGGQLAQELLRRLGAAVSKAGLWEELETDWLLLDCELMPWSVKAEELLRSQYAAVGAAARTALQLAVGELQRAHSRGVEVAELLATTLQRQQDADAFTAAYRRYCWTTSGLEGVRLAPFQILAGRAATHYQRDHLWHLAVAQRLADTDAELVAPTRHLAVQTRDPTSVAAGATFWRELTEAGGEGCVIKPLSVPAGGGGRAPQPGVKVRGREYLRIIYGPDYLAPENLLRLRQRSLGRKRSLALREHALGLEGLDRLVAEEPLWRVHECVFGVLALESEPVDPRL